jgi:hypothetical protein
MILDMHSTVSARAGLSAEFHRCVKPNFHFYYMCAIELGLRTTTPKVKIMFALLMAPLLSSRIATDQAPADNCL